MNKKEYILCAATHFKDGKTHEHQPKNIETGLVICGRRHHNCYATLFALDKKRQDLVDEREVQGFITNLDRFVNREEAYEIALASGQCKPKVFDRSLDKLFSESLPANTKMILISEDLY